MRCTNCKKDCDPKVFSQGDYDPFCDQNCHDEYFRKLHEEMGRINAKTDREFYDYMGAPWLNR